MASFSQFRKIHWRPTHVDKMKPSEFMVLSILKHKYIDHGTGFKISEISENLQVAVPTITQLVKSLEKKGYVEKVPDENDGRVTRVVLSQNGKDLAKKGYEEFYIRFSALAEHLGNKKSEDLAELLSEVAEFFMEQNK